MRSLQRQTGAIAALFAPERVLAGLLLACVALGGCGDDLASVPGELEAARQAREQKDYTGAIIHLKNVVQVVPDHGEAHYLLGLAYRDSGDYASARIELGKALELRYDADKTLPALGKTMLALKQFKLLLDEVKVEQGSTNAGRAEILTLRGLALLGLGRIEEGRELLERALDQHPDLGDALVGQALLARGEKNFEESSRLIDRAVASAPGNIDAWLMRGDLDRFLRRGDPVTAYRKVLELDPMNIMAMINVGVLEIQAGNHAAAREQLVRIREIAPGNAIGKYLEASIEFRAGNYAAAREMVFEAMAIAPDHMPSVQLAGAIEYALGSYDGARLYLTRVLDRSPQDPAVRKLLVSALTRSGRIQEAQKVLRHALILTPDDPEVLNLAGELAVQSNDTGQARQYFEKAMKVDPQNATARAGRAVSRMAAGETERALADLHAAIELDATSYNADVLLVMSHLQRSSYDEALKALKSLESKQPKNPLTYNLKAAAYLGKKDTARARKNLEYALALQPAYLPAARNLAELDLAEKNPAAAVARYEAMLAKDRNNIPVMLALARFHARSGGAERGIEVAKQALAVNADSIEALEVLAELQIATGRVKEALAIHVKLVALQPKSASALYRLASVQILNGDNNGAAEMLRQAVAQQPDYVEAQAVLSTLETRAGFFSVATKIARQLQKQNEKSPIGFVLEGDALMGRKEYLPAAKLYEIAHRLGQNGGIVIKLHAAYTLGGRPEEGDARLMQWLKSYPDDAVARLYAGDQALKAGKYKDAIRHYELLQQKEPEAAVVLNNLALAYQQVKDPRALATGEHAYKLRPDSPNIADTYGWLLIEQGSAARGIEVLQRAVAAAPRAPGIRYHLAQGWLKAGDQAKARSQLEQLLATDEKFPEREEAVNLLTRLPK